MGAESPMGDGARFVMVRDVDKELILQFCDGHSEVFATIARCPSTDPMTEAHFEWLASSAAAFHGKIAFDRPSDEPTTYKGASQPHQPA